MNFEEILHDAFLIDRIFPTIPDAPCRDGLPCYDLRRYYMVVKYQRSEPRLGFFRFQ